MEGGKHMRRKYLQTLIMAMIAVFVISNSAGATGRERISAICAECHKIEPGTIRGLVKTGSQGEDSFIVQAGKDAWNVRYDSNTKLNKFESVKQLGNEEAVLVKFREKDGAAYAEEISYKPSLAFIPADKVIELDELSSLLKKDSKKANYMLLDVRGVADFNEGHLPKAVSLPFYRFNHFKDRLPKDKNTLIVTYCNGYGCGMSPHFNRVVKEVYGYKNVKMFIAGFPTWQQTGSAVLTEPEFLKFLMDKGGSYVLIDLRDSGKAANEHIGTAINFPVKNLSELYKALPSDKKKTRIIFYSDNSADAELAQRTMRINGYDNGYILNGGIAAWKAKGYPTAKNALLSKIEYKYKPLPGTLRVEEFDSIVKNKPSDKIVLDVRSAAEVLGSRIPDAVNIPTDTLDMRWAELPKDKEIIAHCQAGNRARMAYEILVDKGYNIRYLNANFKWNEDGTYKATER